MISIAKIVRYVNNYFSHLQHSFANHLKYLQTSWTITEVIHFLRQIVNLLILLTLLALTIYLLPVGHQ